MNKQITFRHMDHSPVIEEHIHAQLEKINRILEHEREPIYLHIVLDAERVHHHHIVEAGLKSPHYDLHVKRENPDMYVAIDEVLHVLYKNLQNAKREFVEKEHAGHRTLKRKEEE